MNVFTLFRQDRWMCKKSHCFPPSFIFSTGPIMEDEFSDPLKSMKWIRGQRNKKFLLIILLSLGMADLFYYLSSFWFLINFCFIVFSRVSLADDGETNNNLVQPSITPINYDLYHSRQVLLNPRIVFSFPHIFMANLCSCFFWMGNFYFIT